MVERCYSFSGEEETARKGRKDGWPSSGSLCELMMTMAAITLKSVRINLYFCSLSC